MSRSKKFDSQPPSSASQVDPAVASPAASVNPFVSRTVAGPPAAAPAAVASSQVASHRGAFGEFGGESKAFIERTFREKIVIVGVTVPPETQEKTESCLDELAQLVDTAGADVVARVQQTRKTINAATFVGKGKVEEIRRICEAQDADTVVFDDELTPAQQATLEAKLGRSAIDRTTVILDIFAQNATSLEGKLQVELAQLRYLLPRIRGMGIRLSQQAGGIGTRGPGETKLEVDRRRLERRMHSLERRLEEINRRRNTQSKRQRHSDQWKVAIVGYTNAGKSTLLNQLCGSDVLAEDRLFATLDAVTRKLKLPGGESVLVADTVGFIRKLPHHLIESFASTLSVAKEADLLVHVVDASAGDSKEQVRAARKVLSDIGAGDIPELLVWNKCDLLNQLEPQERQQVEAQMDGYPNFGMFNNGMSSIKVSAASGEGLDFLVSTIVNCLWAGSPVRELFVPNSRGDIMAAIHRGGQVLSQENTEDGILYKVRLSDAIARQLEMFG